MLLVLDDGHVAHGDCVSVQYSGAGGREPRLEADPLAALLRREVLPRLRGLPVGGYERAAQLRRGSAPRRPMGCRRRLLDACAHRARLTMAELIQAEWGLEDPLRRLPVFAQTGEDRRAGVDKMILKRVDSLPHGLINEPRSSARTARRSWPTSAGCATGSPRSAARAMTRSCTSTSTACWPSGRGDRPGHGARRRTAAAACRAPARRRLAGRRRSPRSRSCGRGSRARLARPGGGRRVGQHRRRHPCVQPRRRRRLVQVKTPDLGAVHHTVDAVLDCRAMASRRTSAARARRPSAPRRSASTWRWAPGRPVAGQAGDGRRRGPVDRPQRDGAHVGAQRPRGKP